MCLARAELAMAALTFPNAEPVTRFTNSLGFKIIREILTKINCTLGGYLIVIFFFNCKAVNTANDLHH